MDQSDAGVPAAVRVGCVLLKPGRRTGEAVPAFLQAALTQAAHVQPHLLCPQRAERRREAQSQCARKRLKLFPPCGVTVNALKDIFKDVMSKFFTFAMYFFFFFLTRPWEGNLSNSQAPAAAGRACSDLHPADWKPHLHTTRPASWLPQVRIPSNKKPARPPRSD